MLDFSGLVEIMRKMIEYIKDWMLPIAIITGISAYLIFHFTPALAPIGPVCHEIVSESQRLLIGVLLFFQFVKASPHDMGLRRWHMYALLFQSLMFIGIAAIACFVPDNGLKILLECAMLCLICPTASAAGVITDKLGGRIADTVKAFGGRKLASRVHLYEKAAPIFDEYKIKEQLSRISVSIETLKLWVDKTIADGRLDTSISFTKE